MRTNKQLADAEREKEAMREANAGTDLLLSNDLEYTEDRLAHHLEQAKRYEASMKRLIRKALTRNWSLKRIAAFSGVTKPRAYLDE